MNIERESIFRSLLFVFTVFFPLALLAHSELTSIDEIFVFKTTQALAERATHLISWDGDSPPDRNYSRFSLAQSLWGIPFYWLGQFLEKADPAGGKWIYWCVGLSSCALTAMTATVLRAWLLSIFSNDSAATLSAWLFSFATLACAYSSSQYIQVISTLALILAVRSVHQGGGVAISLSCAFLVSCRLDFAVLWPAFVVATIQSDDPSRGRRVLMITIGMMIGWLTIIATNWLRGDPLLLGPYSGEGFTTPLLLGLTGSLLSFGKGLLWCAPIAAVGLAATVWLARELPNPGRLVLYVCLTHLVVMSKWWTWHGAISFGPRLLLPILPLCMVPISLALTRWELCATTAKRVLGLVILCSLGIGVWSGIVAPPPLDLGIYSETESIFVPQAGPFSRFDWPIRSMLLSHHSVVANRLLVAFGIASFVSLVLCGFASLLLKYSLRSLWNNSFICAALLSILAILPQIVDLARACRGSERSVWQRRLDEVRPDEFHGKLIAPLRGEYQFWLGSPVQVQLHDGKTSRVLFRTSRVESMHLEVGAYPIIVRPLRAGAELCWTVPGGAYYKQPVPAKYLIAETTTNWQRIEMQWDRFAWLLWLPAIYCICRWLSGDMTSRNSDEHELPATASR